ncbi:hypothetical protein [Seonamhaeicola sp.]|nr:hypothetical protein [Seonamhaeicola sp.]
MDKDKSVIDKIVSFFRELGEIALYHTVGILLILLFFYIIFVIVMAII